MVRRWTLHADRPELADQLSQHLKVHPVVARLLVNRGVETVEQGERFLDRKLTALHDPERLGGATLAAERIWRAVQDRKNIWIYGDYDVDGMCATAILIECLRLAGALPRYYVPDRLDEGYGVNSEALRRLRDEGADVVVTVDCGIGSVAEAEYARNLGIEYIVTDHHEPTESWPPADVVVHPCQPAANYPFRGLSGSGVAFKLAWEIARRISGGRRATEPFQRFLLDAVTLAAVGTVCDIVPIADENRALVHHGLEGLRARPCCGLRRLLEVADGGKQQRIDVQTVAFKIGPRLNACGRLGQGDVGARLGIELLTTRDETRARELAVYLEEMNKMRRSLERRVFQQARAMAQKQNEVPDAALPAALVFASDDWHAGVIGIAASNMVAQFHRPCVLVTFRDDVGTGSGRSVEGFALHEALSACREHLLQCGGHAMAAGLKLRRECFGAFRDAFVAVATERLSSAQVEPHLRIDTEIPLHLLTPTLVRSLDVLEPFGPTNPQPVMLATNLSVVGEPRCVGDGQHHLSFQVQQGNGKRRAIAFGQGERLAELLSADRKCCLVFNPRINVFRGYEAVDLHVVDLRPGTSMTTETDD